MVEVDRAFESLRGRGGVETKVWFRAVNVLTTKTWPANSVSFYYTILNFILLLWPKRGRLSRHSTAATVLKTLTNVYRLNEGFRKYLPLTDGTQLTGLRDETK